MSGYSQNSIIKEVSVLRNNANTLPKRALRDRTNILVINKYTTGGHVIEAKEEAENRGFPVEKDMINMAKG